VKQIIKIKFQNGLTFKTFVREVFDINGVSDNFDFVESENPDFIVFGPYGIEVPKKGPYTRIGYFCENMIPDFSVCEWAFGMPSEEEIDHPKYKKILWHDINPSRFIKNSGINDEQILADKTHFCNFIYSNKVAYREEFFKQLSRYKEVNSPGKSMNNMKWPENDSGDSKSEIKRKLINKYKFTISFENYVYPGYHTEKLYDPMLAESLPIYCGDMNIGKIFNVNSFLNTPDYVPTSYNKLIKNLEKQSRQNFVDMRPQYFMNPFQKIRRKVKTIGRQAKMNLQFNKLDFSKLIDRIVELDENDSLYRQYICEPWFKNNTIPENTFSKDRWTEIFSGKVTENG
jgi:hypothetical protein